ncbi:hypothetical protein V502_01310 [Pseudogymnoascus sp. VKM F-4520 (FW-2644)]|nr:hypothetical protein V502_01310 [Pseudogymnoascus sp. VKM F-4520 (FW-2644)]
MLSSCIPSLLRHLLEEHLDPDRNVQVDYIHPQSVEGSRQVWDTGFKVGDILDDLFTICLAHLYTFNSKIGQYAAHSTYEVFESIACRIFRVIRNIVVYYRQIGADDGGNGEMKGVLETLQLVFFVLIRFLLANYHCIAISVNSLPNLSKSTDQSLLYSTVTGDTLEMNGGNTNYGNTPSRSTVAQFNIRTGVDQDNQPSQASAEAQPELDQASAEEQPELDAESRRQYAALIDAIIARPVDFEARFRRAY